MRKEKMGDIAEDLILLGGLGLLAYLLITKLLPNFGKGITDNNASSDAATKAAAAADLAASQAAGIAQTLSNSAIAGMATAINNYLQITDFSGSPAPDLPSAVNQVVQINNATDWYSLVNAFGVKNFNTGGSTTLCSWIAVDCTSIGLVAALQAAISWYKVNNPDDAATQVQNLNSTMSVFGISQSFTN